MRNHPGFMRLPILLLLLVPTTLLAAEPATPQRHFLREVKPLLDSRCVSCHGPDKQKGGLRLDSREAAIRGGDNGPAVVPGKPKESLLLVAISHTRDDLKMPPKEELTEHDVSVIERWINDGAPWPADAEPAAATSSGKTDQRIGNAWSDERNPIVRIFRGQRIDLWSMKPIQHPAAPAVRNEHWAKNPIDRFVLARLETAGLEPAPQADRPTLIRRLYFDLAGLPPTPDQVRAFLDDQSSDAYDRLVDRLLASPSYGEHAARQWMDVIRYSDSNGFDWDEFRPQMWRFRDYLIRSFNADKPFDRLVTEQLAGDELLDGPPKTPSEQDALIATGYLRLGPHDNSAAVFNEQNRSRAELMADLVETTGSAFLGITMGCCRCHDHKYDPVSQADHYRLRAFFEQVRMTDDLPIDLASDQDTIRAFNQDVDRKIKAVQAQREQIFEPARKQMRSKRESSLNEDEKNLLARRDEKLEKKDKARLKKILEKLEPSEDEVRKSLKDQHDQIAAFDEKIKTLEHEKKPFTTALLMTDAKGTPPQTKILFQGDYRQERQPVTPGFLSILDPNPAQIVKPINPQSTGRRLTLARWMTSPDNPLTARVLVNRLWQSHFGAGLVATSNDFGLAGARPSNPQLLDFLATEMIRTGWSIKAMHRLIVTSAAYQQASSTKGSSAVAQKAARIDQDNEMLWRQNLRRLTAEQLRDALLVTSGLLQNRTGGPPIWPQLPQDVLQSNPAFLDDNAEKTKGWYPSPPQDLYGRSVFLVQKRNLRIPFMETFDLPENLTSCPRRNSSIVAPQALTLMNSPLATDACRALADRVKREAGNDVEKQVRTVFKIVFQRDCDDSEIPPCRAVLEKRSLVELCRVLLNVNEFIYID